MNIDYHLNLIRLRANPNPNKPVNIRRRIDGSGTDRISGAISDIETKVASP